MKGLEASRGRHGGKRTYTVLLASALCGSGNRATSPTQRQGLSPNPLLPLPKAPPQTVAFCVLSSSSPLHMSSQLICLQDLRCPFQLSCNSSSERSALGQKHRECLLEKALGRQSHGMPRTRCQEGVRAARLPFPRPGPWFPHEQRRK